MSRTVEETLQFPLKLLFFLPGVETRCSHREKPSQDRKDWRWYLVGDGNTST